MTTSISAQPAPLAPAPRRDTSFTDVLERMQRSTTAAVADTLYFSDIVDDDSTGVSVNGGTAIGYGVGGGAVGLAGGTIVGAVKDSRQGIVRSGPLDVTARGASLLGGAGLRLTPTLVSALAGPAVADGVTALAPNLVKKYRDPNRLSGSEREQVVKDNQTAKWTRTAVGGAAVGVLGLGAFLIKPTLFRGVSGNTVKFFMSDAALHGRTTFASTGANGARKVETMVGNHDVERLRGMLSKAGRDAREVDSIEVVKVQPGIDPTGRVTTGIVPGNAATSNRIVVGAAGGAATVVAADKAAGASDETKTRMRGIAAGVGAATLGGVVGIGMLTNRSIARSGADALLAKNTLFVKVPINMDTLKSYGKVLGVTAAPAGTAAGMYYNIFDDFDDITSTRSQFRR